MSAFCRLISKLADLNLSARKIFGNQNTGEIAAESKALLDTDDSVPAGDRLQ
jgi:hypothetical protein